MNILGICTAINSSACIVKDGKIISAMEEERLNRIKTGGYTIPFKSIKYVLDDTGLELKDIDYIAVAWDYNKYPEYMKQHADDNFHNKSEIDDMVLQTHSIFYTPENFKFQMKTNLYKMGFRDELPEVIFMNHHLSHAASSHYLSGFHKSIILTIDASGEENATVIWKGDGSDINKIKEFNTPHSIGWYYSAMTEFLGFRAYTGEGKVMGLASYGNDNKDIRNKINKIIQTTDDGYSVDSTYIYFDKRTKNNKFTDKLVDLLGEPRLHGEEITQYHKDISFIVQDILEEVVRKLVLKAIEITGYNNVCIAGGVGMNCKMNGKIYKMPEVNDIFIMPMSADNGTSIGAALCVSKDKGVKPNSHKLKNTYFGPEFSNKEIRKILDDCKIRYTYITEIEKEVARRVYNNQLVGWFQGKMECGARALGNRTILANPLNKDMKDIVNHKVKHREAFRPFCPSLLYDDMDKYMVNAKHAPFMILAFEAKEGIMEKAPSVVHVDNTIRPQTVKKEDNLRYWKLINEFRNLSGESIILNTSFNVAGEPIICKPEEAIKCLYSTGLDCLVMGNYLIEK